MRKMAANIPSDMYTLSNMYFESMQCTVVVVSETGYDNIQS